MLLFCCSIVWLFEGTTYITHQFTFEIWTVNIQQCASYGVIYGHSLQLPGAGQDLRLCSCRLAAGKHTLSNSDVVFSFLKVCLDTFRITAPPPSLSETGMIWTKARMPVSRWGGVRRRQPSWDICQSSRIKPINARLFVTKNGKMIKKKIYIFFSFLREVLLLD